MNLQLLTSCTTLILKVNEYFYNYKPHEVIADLGAHFTTIEIPDRIL